jgi:hypothetical protein
MTDPDAFPDDRVWWTLEQRVRDWRALNGPARGGIDRRFRAWTPTPSAARTPI